MSLHQPQLARQHAERVIGVSDGRIVFDQPSELLTSQALHEVYGSTLLGDSRPHMV